MFNQNKFTINRNKLTGMSEDSLKSLTFDTEDNDGENKQEDKTKSRPKNKKPQEIDKNKINYGDIKITSVDTDKNKLEQRRLMEKNIIPRHPGVSICVGSINSGKSTFIHNLLSKPQFYGESNELGETKHYYDVIFLLTGSDDDLYTDLTDRGIIKEQHIKYDPKPSDLQKIIDIQSKTIKKIGLLKAPKVLIILDDIVDNMKFIKSSAFKTLFIRPRQLGISVLLGAQHFNLVPMACRQQAINLFIFPQNRAGEEGIVEQFCPGNMKKNDFRELISQATEIREGDSHPFLHINRRCKMQERFRRNLDKIIKI